MRKRWEISYDRIAFTASSSHRSPSPFQRLIHPDDLGNVVCLVWVYIMTWQCYVSAIMASDSPEDFRLLKLRFRPSLFPGSHHMPWQHNYTKCLWNTHNIKFHVSSNKTQVMYTTTQTWKIPQSSQSKKTSTFLHDVSLRSASNFEFWMPSRTLLSLSSLRDIWQRNELQTKTKTKNMQTKPYLLRHSVCLAPLLNSNPMPALNHAVISENNKWTSSW